MPQGTRELHKLLNLHRTVFVHLRFEFRTSTKAANFCKELISSEHSMLTWSFELHMSNVMGMMMARVSLRLDSDLHRSMPYERGDNTHSLHGKVQMKTNRHMLGHTSRRVHLLCMRPVSTS